MQQSRDRSHAVLAGALCWVAGVEFFVAQAIAQAAWPEYSMTGHDISLLGAATCRPLTGPATQAFVACSPLHRVMNGGFILLGLLTLAGAVLTRGAWPRSRTTDTALALVAIGAFGPVAVGIWPLDTNSVLHAAGALLHFVFAGLGIMLLGVVLLPRQRLLGLFSLICGLLSFVGFFLYVGGIYLGLGRGGMERVAGHSSTIWLVVIGAAILFARRGRHPLAS